jgi:site-specific recombinase XerC
MNVVFLYGSCSNGCKPCSKKEQVSTVFGKRMKPGSIPLDVHVGKALQAYLKIRPSEDEEDLFLGQRGPLSEWGNHAIVKK